MHIKVVGCGEAFDHGLGNTSYILSGRGLPVLLFDCGYQVPERLWAEKLHEGLDAVCLTHLHADHAFGLVPLLTRYWEEKRGKPLVVAGPRGVERFVMRTLQLGYPGMEKKLPFDVVFREIREGEVLELGKIKLRGARTVHSVLNHALRVDVAGKSFAVSGDGAMTDASRELVADVDLLCHEVFSMKPLTAVHTDLEAFEPFVRNAPLRRVGVAHHARAELPGIHKRVRELARSDKRWVILKPGMELEI